MDKDWSKLITINYPGGLGGDFFRSLLDLALNKENYLSKEESLIFHGHQKCFAPYRQSIIKLFYLFTHDRLLLDEEVPEGNSDYDASVIKKACYSPDRQTYIKNLEQYYWNCYTTKPGKFNVINMHNCHDNINIVYPCEVFPGSFNTQMTCSNLSQWMVFKILFFYKLHLEKLHLTSDKKNIVCFLGNKGNTIVSLDYFLDDVLSKFVAETPLEWVNWPPVGKNELQINSYDLFFAGVDYNEKLSDYLNVDVLLDERYINEWKSDAIFILDKFDVSPHEQYHPSYIRFKVKQFILDNVKVVNNDKGYSFW